MRSLDQALDAARRDVLKVTSCDRAGVVYVVADDDSAVQLWGVSDEVARSWLEALPCDHLGTQRMVTDALIDARPDCWPRLRAGAPLAAPILRRRGRSPFAAICRLTPKPVYPIFAIHP